MIPHEMADELRASGHTSWRLEAHVTSWVAVVLFDSGCRLTGRG
jgi:hypothetical protein